MPIPASVSSQVILVTVSLEDGTVQFGGAMPADHRLPVDFGLALIIFQITDESVAQGVHFAGDAIAFTEDPPPACFVLQNNSRSQITMIDVNTNAGTDTQAHGFVLTVVDALGQSHTSTDPTILNAEVPPSTGFYQGEGEDRHVRTGAALRAV